MSEQTDTEIIYVRYSGPIRGLHALARGLSEAGLQADFDPPVERRGGVGPDIVHATLQIGSEVKQGLRDYAIGEAVRRIVRAFKERYPGIEADIEDDDEESDGD